MRYKVTVFGITWSVEYNAALVCDVWTTLTHTEPVTYEVIDWGLRVDLLVSTGGVTVAHRFEHIRAALRAVQHKVEAN